MKRIILIIIGTFILSNLVAVDKFRLELETGVTWVHSETYLDGTVGKKDPDPILFRVGVAFPIYFTDMFFLRPSLSIVNNYYQYDTTGNWAVPTDKMWNDLLVMSLLIDIPLGFQLNFKLFSVGFFAGPAFNFKIPLWGDGPDAREDLTAYFYRSGRFVNVNGGVQFIIPINETVAVNLTGETWIPLSNIWIEDDLPFINGLMVSVNASVRFTF